MHAIRAPDPSPRRMNSRTCCMSARRYPPVGGCSHGAALTKLLPPSYVKNCVRSLQTAGALPYLPHCSSGAPRATGPLNALSLSSTADELASGPASLRALAWLTQPDASLYGMTMLAFWAPDAVSGPMRSVCEAA